MVWVQTLGSWNDLREWPSWCRAREDEEARLYHRVHFSAGVHQAIVDARKAKIRDIALPS